jgi:phage gpG-like protein
MPAVTGTIVGKEVLLERFRNRRYTVLRNIQKAMLGQMARLAEYVRTSKLSGQVLKNRTGTLRRSIHPGAVIDVDGGTVTGLVGTNVSYARVHENGGTFQIPSHQRHITQVFGRPIEPRFITVAAHSARFPQRAFLRPSVEERRPVIMKAIKKAVFDTLNGLES